MQLRQRKRKELSGLYFSQQFTCYGYKNVSFVKLQVFTSSDVMILNEYSIWKISAYGLSVVIMLKCILKILF